MYSNKCNECRECSESEYHKCYSNELKNDLCRNVLLQIATCVYGVPNFSKSFLVLREK